MAEQNRCAWCSRRIVDDQPIGRRKRYCCQSCRQRAYEKRRQMNGDGTMPVADDAVVIARAELESLQDRLYVLRSAVEVLEGAVQDKASAGELTAVAREVIAATGDLDRLWVTP